MVILFRGKNARFINKLYTDHLIPFCFYSFNIYPCDLTSYTSCRHIVNKILNIHAPGRRAGLVQAVESYRLWPEGPGFESRSPRIAQARVRLATDTLPQTPHRAGALCTGYALSFHVFIFGLTHHRGVYIISHSTFCVCVQRITPRCQPNPPLHCQQFINFLLLWEEWYWVWACMLPSTAFQ